MHLTDGQQLYMRYLRKRKSPACNRQIADHFYIDPGSVVRAMKPMVDAGLVLVESRMIGRKKYYFYEAVQKVKSLPVEVEVEIAHSIKRDREIRQIGPAHVRVNNPFGKRVPA